MTALNGTQTARPQAEPTGPGTPRKIRQRSTIADAVRPSVIQRSIEQTPGGILRWADMAKRLAPNLQKRMRQDPDVFGPLLQRCYAVALLDWEIRPEDEEDQQQVDEAKELTRLVRSNLRKPVELFAHLQKSRWYGSAAATIEWQRRFDSIVPTNWDPINSDTIAYRDDGAIGFYVNNRFAAENPSKVIQRGYVSPVYMLEGADRAATIHHTFNREGPEFDEPREAEYMWRGRGLRDVVSFFWLIKQEVLQNWVTYCERYSMGTRVYHYPQGNDEARQSVEDAAENQVGDMTIVVPSDPEWTTDPYRMEIMDPPGGANTQSVYAGLLDGYLAGRIKELIIGQPGTTEATSTGLGSSIGDQHGDTWNRIIEADARSLEDTLTFEFVNPLHAMNGGSPDWRPRWKFRVDKRDPQQWLDAVSKVVPLGARVREADALEMLGVTEPNEGERILEQVQSAFGGDDFFGGALDRDSMAEIEAALRG
jgi:phage gp29-like protein